MTEAEAHAELQRIVELQTQADDVDNNELAAIALRRADANEMSYTAALALYRDLQDNWF